VKVVYLGQLDYDGSQLHHAFAYEKAGVLGATICYFKGKANVKKYLVDLEDSFANDFIKSKEMWHFIIEIPGATITEMVVWQRLFISMCVDILKEECKGFIITRRGDDIMVGNRKLSVSIATLSRFSGLIHIGVNIKVGEGCPVDAIGLSDCTKEGYSLIFGGKGMADTFAKEYDDVKKATYKVKEV
jgi:hypothetical protein